MPISCKPFVGCQTTFRGRNRATIAKDGWQYRKRRNWLYIYEQALAFTKRARARKASMKYSITAIEKSGETFTVTIEDKQDDCPSFTLAQLKEIAMQAVKIALQGYQAGRQGEWLILDLEEDKKQNA